MPAKKVLDIGVLVHGRFHAFNLSRALADEGHRVTVYTNYPRFVAKSFGLERASVMSFPVHGVLTRAAHALRAVWPDWEYERLSSPLFGRWAARAVAKSGHDVVHAFSGVALEALRQSPGRALKTIVRGSTHIEHQYRVLAREEARAGTAIEKPGPWIRNREREEYEIADRIVVLSRFCLQTFLNEGVSREKLVCIPSGASIEQFAPSEAARAARYARMLSGEKLRVLFVGTFSLRKGAFDLLKICSTMQDKYEFRFVGAVAKDSVSIARQLEGIAQFTGKLRESGLRAEYEWADLFLFPSIEEGLATVLTQARASGLPIITTQEAGGEDVISDGSTGLIVPAADPAACIDRLETLWSDRRRLRDMAVESLSHQKPRVWRDAAVEFAAMVYRSQNGRPGEP